MSWIAFSHHWCWLESWVCDFSYRKLFVVSLFGRNNWGIRRQHEMDSWIRNQVGLELSYVNIKGTVKSEGCSQRGNNLSDKSVQVGVGWSFNIEVSSADIIDCFIIKHNSNISVFKEGVSWENWVVWLNDCSWDLGWWVNGKTELWFFTVIDWQSLEEKRSQTWASTSTDWVENEETLESSALISKFSDSVKAEVNDFFTDGVMTSSEVVSSILLSWDELLGMEQLSVSSSSDLIDDSRF